VSGNPWYLLIVATFVSILVIAFTFLGDGLRDALDPRQK
jgi:ABC-type dipeptide/oligopeptide/nickel transport system permease subunit